MKKYMLSIAAILLFAGISNAQTEKKQPANSSVSAVSKPSTVKKTGSETTKMTPAEQTKKPASSTEAIKRKHHPKKKASPKKTENK